MSDFDPVSQAVDLSRLKEQELQIKMREKFRSTPFGKRFHTQNTQQQTLFVCLCVCLQPVHEVWDRGGAQHPSVSGRQTHGSVQPHRQDAGDAHVLHR